LYYSDFLGWVGASPLRFSIWQKPCLFAKGAVGTVHFPEGLQKNSSTGQGPEATVLFWITQSAKKSKRFLLHFQDDFARLTLSIFLLPLQRFLSFLNLLVIFQS
jgi:hypothetical protein